jgi:hypothetical protein
MRQRVRRWWPRSPIGRAALVVGVVFIGIPAAAVAVGLLVGLIGAAVGLVLGFGWPFLLVFGVYKLVSQQSRVAVPYSVVPAGTWAPAGAPPPPPPAPPPTPDPFARLPEDVRAVADRIYWKATSLMHQSGRFPAGSRNLHLVQRTLDQYLPWTLHSYLSIPPGSDDRVAAPDGRTTIQVVRDQLSVLETKLDEVANDLWQADVQRLLANERFLEEHFGRRESDELRIP